MFSLVFCPYRLWKQVFDLCKPINRHESWEIKLMKIWSVKFEFSPKWKFFSISLVCGTLKSYLRVWSLNLSSPPSHTSTIAASPSSLSLPVISLADLFLLSLTSSPRSHRAQLPEHSHRVLADCLLVFFSPSPRRHQPPAKICRLPRPFHHAVTIALINHSHRRSLQLSSHYQLRVQLHHDSIPISLAVILPRLAPYTAVPHPTPRLAWLCLCPSDRRDTPKPQPERVQANFRPCPGCQPPCASPSPQLYLFLSSMASTTTYQPISRQCSSSTIVACLAAAI